MRIPHALDWLHGNCCAATDPAIMAGRRARAAAIFSLKLPTYGRTYRHRIFPSAINFHRSQEHISGFKPWPAGARGPRDAVHHSSSECNFSPHIKWCVDFFGSATSHGETPLVPAGLPPSGQRLQRLGSLAIRSSCLVRSPSSPLSPTVRAAFQPFRLISTKRRRLSAMNAHKRRKRRRLLRSLRAYNVVGKK